MSTTTTPLLTADQPSHAQATNAITLAQGDAVAIEAIVTQITEQAKTVANQAAPGD